MYSKDSHGTSNIEEIIEFLRNQDKDSLPQDLKELLHWQDKKLDVQVCLSSHSMMSTTKNMIKYAILD